MTDTPTTRVRVAIKVDADGQFSAEGTSMQPDETVLEWLDESFEGNSFNCHIVWVVADVPLPRGIEGVEGSVEEAS